MRSYNLSVTGFTMVELILMITVIGVLAAVVTPQVVSLSDKGRQSATMEEMSRIGTAIETYRVENSDYPRYLSYLVPNYLPAGTVLKDSWGSVYDYVITTGPSVNPLTGLSYVIGYELRSKGSDAVITTGAPPAGWKPGSVDAHNDIVFKNGVFMQAPEF